jgi:hypothetical protein
MIIEGGKHRIPDRPLTLVFSSDIPILSPSTLMRVVGDNGVGKTSFFERFLVPRLEDRQVPLLFCGSDEEMQRYSLRAWNGFRGRRRRAARPDPQLVPQISVLLSRSPKTRIAIFDETPAFEHYAKNGFREFDPAASTVLFVKHHMEQPVESVSNGFSNLAELTFTRSSSKTARVEIQWLRQKLPPS